jgi:hypothetical protein
MEIDYQKFRWFFTSSGTLVIGGKSEEQNEAIVRMAKPYQAVLHTKSPGSPFCVVMDNLEKKEDIQEAAIFCACFSQQWKKSKGKPIEVDIFRKEQMYKDKSMKTGTFGIKGAVEKIKANPKLYLEFQEGKLRSVPFETEIAMIIPGQMSKSQAAEIIRKKLELPLDEIMSSLPSDGISIKWD